jgi:hypothetical protein
LANKNIRLVSQTFSFSFFLSLYLAVIFLGVRFVNSFHHFSLSSFPAILVLINSQLCSLVISKEGHKHT